MLYLAIDQHKNYMTINIRNEQGDVLQKGQVSTAPADIDEFFAAFVKKARKHRGYMSIVEVCGFNDWLLEKLKKTRCNRPNRVSGWHWRTQVLLSVIEIWFRDTFKTSVKIIRVGVMRRASRGKLRDVFTKRSVGAQAA